jgi:hypothetical protein
LDESVVAAVVRAGGWQAESGKKTVMRLYARKVMDGYINTQAFGLGKRGFEGVYKERMDEYLKPARRPAEDVGAKGKGRLEDIRAVARGESMQSLQNVANFAGEAVMVLVSNLEKERKKDYIHPALRADERERERHYICPATRG